MARIDTLEYVKNASSAAVAVNQGGQIVAWNQAATWMLGYGASDVLDRDLGRVLPARDVFGNHWCSRLCPLHHMARKSEPINPFELDLARSSGEWVRVKVQVVAMVHGHVPGYDLVLCLQEVRRRRRSDRKSGAYALPDARRGETVPAAASGGGRTADLTRREVDVVQLLVQGKSSEAIAEELGIAVVTVRNHTQRILKKLGVSSRAAAVAVALRNRLV